MATPSWIADPGAWDRLEINGFVFDSVVDVDGDFGNDFDVQKAPGADGATLNNKGVEPIKPSVRWQLYTEEHWGTYEAMIAAIYPYPGKTPLPLLDVQHPQLQLLKKRMFRLARVHTLKKVGPQICEARLDLVEYFAKPKTIKKPSTDVPVANERRVRTVYEIQSTKPSTNILP